MALAACGPAGHDEAAAGQAGAAAGTRPSEGEAAAPGDVPVEATSPPPAPPTRSWNAPVASLVQRHLEGVARHTGGRASGRDVGVSVVVRELGSESPWVSLEPKVARAPASCMKLVTSAAALVLLGPGAEYLTVVEAHGPIQGGRLRGDLVVRASGDPICRPDGDARVEERLDVLAEQLLERGIREVTGQLILDEGRFAEPGPAPGWPDASQMWQEHCALSGGFSINGGVLQARIEKPPTGNTGRVAVHPRPHGLARRYGVQFEGSRLDVRVGATSTAVTVRGVLPASRQLYTAEFSHPDPVALFGNVLLERLESAGLRVAGGLRRSRDEPAAERVAEMRSSLDETLISINAHSRNSVADQLFLALGNTIGGSGSRAGGELATRLALQRLGVPVEGFVQVDGSGLSRSNRVSAEQLAGLVAGVLEAGADTAAVFRDSLAVAGEVGTLAQRMEGSVAEGRVLGKTGWISGVSSLTGLCTTLAGEPLVFSILVEYPPSIGGLNRAVFKPMQDELVTRFVEGAW